MQLSEGFDELVMAWLCSQIPVSLSGDLTVCQMPPDFAMLPGSRSAQCVCDHLEVVPET